MSIAAIRVIQTAEDQHVLAEARNRAEAWSYVVVRARRGRNPVALRNAIAVEPQDVSLVDSRGRWRLRPGLCGVRTSLGVEHGNQRRHADDDRCVSRGQALQEDSA